MTVSGHQATLETSNIGGNTCIIQEQHCSSVNSLCSCFSAVSALFALSILVLLLSPVTLQTPIYYRPVPGLFP